MNIVPPTTSGYHSPMRVLVADDDPFSAAVMEALIRSAGLECLLASDGYEAWQLLQTADAPRIVFLDWMMPEIDGIELCRRIRVRATHEYTYVAILSSRNKQRDITLGFQSGADDFITKPYQTEEVLARLRVAERLIRSTGASVNLRRAIAEARESSGGDVIVRAEHRVGRIIFDRGRVAWAHISDEPGSLAAILAGEGSITREEVRAVLEECSATGENFADVLVAWGLITRELLRTVLTRWIQTKIARIAAFPAPVVIFSPESRVASSGVLLDPEEVIAPDLLHSAVTPDNGPLMVPGGATAHALSDDLARRIPQSLQQAIQIEGALSAAIFDLRDGLCLGARGEAVDLDLVWSKLRLAAMSDIWDDLEDIMISTRQHIYVLRPYTKAPPRSIFLAIDRATTKLGMVRRALAECVIA
jgi:DNA-binding response OmpR family regulator